MTGTVLAWTWRRVWAWAAVELVGGTGREEAGWEIEAKTDRG